MNLYQLFITFVSVGIIIGLFPILISITLQDNIFMENFYYFYGVSTGLMGAGIGFAVGAIVYREKKGGKDDE